MTTQFDQAFNDYSEQLQEYQDKFDRYKELVKQGSMGELAKQIGLEVGTPLTMELLKTGFGKIGSKATGVVPKARSEQVADDDAADDLATGDAEGVGEVGDVGESLGEALGRVGAPLQDAGDALTQQLRSAGGALRNLMRRGPEPDSMTQAAEPAESTFDNPAFEPTQFDLPPMQEMSAFDDADIDPFGGANIMPRPGVTSNRIGNLLSQQRQQLTPEQEELFSEPKDDTGTQDLFDTDPDAAEATAKAAADNVQAVENATGASEDVAADALAEGASAIEGGTEIISSAAGDAAAGVTAGVTAGVDAVTETGAVLGAETGGIGWLVAGAAALGGVLADIFSHKTHRPDPVPIPNLPVPTFQPGLSTSE